MKRLYRRLFSPATLAEQIQQAVAAGDAGAVHDLVKRYTKLRADVEEALSPAIRRKPNTPLELASGTQSKQYMIDLLPHLQKHLRTWPRGSVLDVLEVGPGSGHGTALLSSMYRSSELGYRMRVTGVDIRDHHRHYFEAVAPHAVFKVADVYTMDQTYDIVIASHVIEHVPDPARFCRRLQEISRDAVFIVAPYEEPADRLTKGHHNVIDRQLIASLDALADAVSGRSPVSIR